MEGDNMGFWKTLGPVLKLGTVSGITTFLGFVMTGFNPIGGVLGAAVGAFLVGEDTKLQKSAFPHIID